MSTAQTRADHDGDSQDVVPSKDRLSQSTEAPPATHADNTHTKEQTRRPYVVLRRYRFFPLLVICYVAVAATAWVLLCIMTRRPIGGRTYGPDFDRNDYDTYPTAPYLDSEYKDVFVRNERYLRAVRILQSGIAVLTIPVTSAVCSRAAVLFAQRKLSGLTLRQTMALADRGWMDLSIISKLIFGRWKQYGSRFLVLALALTTIGEYSPLETCISSSTEYLN